MTSCCSSVSVAITSTLVSNHWGSCSSDSTVSLRLWPSSVPRASREFYFSCLSFCSALLSPLFHSLYSWVLYLSCVYSSSPQALLEQCLLVVVSYCGLRVGSADQSWSWATDRGQAKSGECKPKSSSSHRGRGAIKQGQIWQSKVKLLNQVHMYV